MLVRILVLLLIPTFAYDIYASVSRNSDEVYLINFFVMWSGSCNTVVNSILFIFLYRSVREKTIEMLKGILQCTPYLQEQMSGIYYLQ